MNEFQRFRAHRTAVAAQESHDRDSGLPTAMPGHTLVVAKVKHKHHGQQHLPGQVYWLEAHLVAGAHEFVAPVPVEAFDYWQAPGRILGAEDVSDIVPRETAPTEGALRILAGVGYDPGSAAFRLHTAINEHTKHASAFVRWGDTNPHCSLRQFDGIDDIGAVRGAFLEADVLHCHVAYLLTNNLGFRRRPDQLLVRHYHGSKPGGGTHIERALDMARDAKLLGARLSLVDEARHLGLDMAWSPIPVPVDRYRALRDAVRKKAKWRQLEGQATPKRKLRIAHSPTQRSLKGTDDLIAVVDRLVKMGAPVELDLIADVSLAESLRRKALADVFFDSFWLGIQGSGLEAAAMEMPVIAGDPDAASLYRKEFGTVPYTFANTRAELSEAIERYLVSEADRMVDGDQVLNYVTDVHDYPAVAARYEYTVATWLGRSDILTTP